MKPNIDSFVLHKVVQMTPLSELSEKVVSILPDKVQDIPYQKPNPILLIAKPKADVVAQKKSGHYFMGGLPALMQAVRLLQKDPSAQVTYVNDGQIKKSAQSAHQGHVHPTEWTTPELGTRQLTKVILKSLHLLPTTPPDDILNYSYIHLPISKMKPTLILRNIVFRLLHTLVSKPQLTFGVAAFELRSASVFKHIVLPKSQDDVFTFERDDNLVF